MRPLNLGETLDASIKIVRSRWKTLATVMLVIALPIQLANIIIIKSTTDVYQVGTSLSSTADTATTYSDEGAYIAGQTLMLALSLLGYLLGTVACYRAIADTYLGRETSASASLRFAGSRLGATLWLTIVLALGLVLGFLAFIVPGIWLYIAWSVVYPVMLVEGTGGFAALKRSFKLVETRWWATAGRMAVAFILVGVVTAVGTALFVAPTEWIVDDTSFGGLMLEQAANLVVSLVTTPFAAAVTTLVYFDLRVRKEGFDLALLAERMGGPAASGPAAASSVPSSAPSSAPPPGLWADERDRGRDAFGRPVAPGGAPSSFAPPVPPAPAPGSWAPPEAPEPQRPPSQDE
jgi:hypothetical protein